MGWLRRAAAGSEGPRVGELVRQHLLGIWRATDRLFAGLLMAQWVAAVVVAVWISPRTWAGSASSTHPHLWAAVFLGGGIVGLPTVLGLYRPGRALTRHAIAVAQMLMGALFIHLTGGRIETHFHVFGSLALLAFYRDWRVLMTATVVVAADHVLRGFFWPQSVYGVDGGAEWRWLEHAGWVVAEDAFLIWSCACSRGEVRAIAERRAELEETNRGIEQKVRERTAQLQAANESLREGEARLRGMLESALDCVLTIDHTGRVLEFNPAAERTFGYRRDQVLGRRLSELIVPPAYRAAHEQGLRHYLATGEGPVIGKRIEIVARRADGTEFPIELAVCAIQQLGSPIFTAYLRDLTERKQAEEALRRAKEAAEDASRAKSEFLANMSHEIRTPMNGILGMTELTLDTDLSPEQRDYLGMVKSSAEGLLAVINDILDFSKIEAGKLDLDPVEFGLRDCAGDTLKALALRAHAKGLELACEVAADVPDALVGDPGRLRQVLLNLAGNAVKFTERGEVVVQVSAVGARGVSDGSAEPVADAPGSEVELHFAVRDTGIGIAADKVGAIFRPFEQADGSTTRKYGGTGLGLTISARLVEMMGGRLWVESEPGRGSTFHFTASFQVRAETTAARGAEPHDLLGMPALVIDDNATNRRILQGMLGNWRMCPAAADGGEAALSELHRAAAAGTPYRLVLLDVMMPGMDGFEVAERIQQFPSLAETTILMLSSADRKGDAGRYHELGIARYLTKPVKQSELLDAILMAFGGRRRDGVPVESVPARTVPPVNAEAGPLRILLAEDNAVNQRLAIRLLEKQGHRVALANNGREAVEAVLRQTFDVVLMDVQMPEMNGFEAAAAVRAAERGTGRHLPIIALTAHAMKGDRERCLEAGMDGYLSKPIQTRALAQALAELTAASSRL
jgi:PAS domain S-box-containing protein